MPTITLEWPDKRLSPNARVHHMQLARVKKAARQEAHWLSLAELPDLDLGGGPIDVHIAFYPPDKRRRDRDNMQYSMKAALDGIADALGVDDYRFRPTYEFCEPEKPGRVEVTIG